VTPVWALDLAERFWRSAGPPPPFPRDLGFAASVFGLVVVSLPGLTVAGVRRQLGRFGHPTPDVPDRPLRACLSAHRGRGVVFLDAADPPAERRFSLAHEVAHFLRDVDAPRRRAAAVGAVAVLDGATPTLDQRLTAVLRGVELRPHLHLLGRDDAGRPQGDDERRAEAAADRLGAELLAPADLFLDDPAEVIRGRLVAEFGFPPAAAAGYAATLRPAAWRDPLVIRCVG
jgi:hypothetical protein